MPHLLHLKAPAPPQLPPVLLLQYVILLGVEPPLQYLHRCSEAVVKLHHLHLIEHTLTPPVGVNHHLPLHVLLLEPRPLHPLLAMGTPTTRTVLVPLQTILSRSTLSTLWMIFHPQMSTDTSLRFTPVKPPE